MDTNHVSTFLSLVYPAQTSHIALCLIPPDRGKPQHRFTTVGGLSRFLSYAAYRNVNRWGIYVTPSVLKPSASTRRKESFLNTQQIIYLDCDQARCLDQIKQRYPLPTLVVKTSPRRYQVYWRIHPVSLVQQERLMCAMAMDVGADRAATDVSRVLRLPSFWNRKSGRNNTVDIVFTRDHTVTYSSLSEKPSLAPFKDTTQNETTCKQGASPRVLANLLEASDSPPASPSQSEIDWYEVHRRLSRGDAPQEIVMWLQHSREDKRNPSQYAESTVRKALEQRRHR